MVYVLLLIGYAIVWWLVNRRRRWWSKRSVTAEKSLNQYIHELRFGSSSPENGRVFKVHEVTNIDQGISVCRYHFTRGSTGKQRNMGRLELVLIENLRPGKARITLLSSTRFSKVDRALNRAYDDEKEGWETSTVLGHRVIKLGDQAVVHLYCYVVLVDEVGREVKRYSVVDRYDNIKLGANPYLSEDKEGDDGRRV